MGFFLGAVWRIGYQLCPSSAPPENLRCHLQAVWGDSIPFLAGGGFTNVGNEDPAKINRYQAASPANKPASHWLLVMSLSG